MSENNGTEGTTENSGTPETPATEPTPKTEKAVKQPKAKSAAKGKKAAPKKAAKVSKGKTSKPSTKKTPKATKSTKPVKTTKPAASDAPDTNQLPPVGTVIVKRDRNGQERCHCKIVVGGVLFDGTVHKSLSSAAMAASKKLGLSSTAANGWVFWQLKATPSATDPVEALQKASERFIERAQATVVTEENKAEVAKIMKAHRQAFEKIAG